MLFHYHFWTPYLEETEKFYIENGFRISLRMGKYEGEYQTFNPPLDWDNFREKDITFRIIEARKGAINITFGFGKKVIFDHIGFLVNPNEHDEICNKAREMSWKVSSNDRRTFIGTPYGFRIELQSNLDAIDGTTDIAKIEELELFVENGEFKKDLSQLFNKQADNIHSFIGETSTINKAVMSGVLISSKIDPNGVNVVRKGN
ncbi:hypothetical protein [Aquibacillus rhizosphaerae]|uniref:VOC domain-containing protein n=1 Tax=Aquibacillus rhizosphaerae TaxID=3051431 RepID=A0ABT7L395_9BACI|nr:hypothetical protein [Aquibacillus sp. LR5S19]MDL4840332.1 hypothetical protein [Aquibacillus sp. LR5S19]